MQQRQTPNLRRRDARRTVGRAALYFVEGRDDLGWRNCYVIDASTLGAGIELFAPAPSGSLLGQRLAVAVRAPGSSAAPSQVIGRVRSVRAGDSTGGVRVGLEFLSPAADRRAVLDLLHAI